MPRGPASTIRLDRSGQWVNFTPESLRAISSDLYTTGWEPTSTDEHGGTCSKFRESLLTGVRDGDVSADVPCIPNAGMISPCRLLAAGTGRDVRVFRTTPVSSLSAPAVSSDVTYPQLSSFVRSDSNGLIWLGPQVNPATPIVDLHTLFPEATIVICCSRRDQLRRVRLSVRATLGERECESTPVPWLLTSGDRFEFNGEERPQLVFCTPTAAASCEHGKADFFVMLDATECLNYWHQFPLIKNDARFRLIGLVAHDAVDNAYTRDKLCQAYGFNHLFLGADGLGRRQTEYALVRPPNLARRSDRLASDTADHELGSLPDARDIYVRNGPRNDTICRIASKLNQGAEFRSGRHRDIRKALRAAPGRHLNVAVVTDRREHAHLLGERLRGWPVITAENVNNLSECGLSASDAASRRLGARQVVAAEVTERLKADCLDAVVWAGGGFAAGGIPSSWLYEQASNNRRLLIVDFCDHFDPKAREWAGRRVGHYHFRDIFRVGTPSMLGRAICFLNAEGRTT